MCDVQGEIALWVDFTIQVVTTIITKRPCISVAQINDLSGITDRHLYAHTSKIFIR